MGKHFSLWEWIFAGIAGVVGAGIVLVATSVYGAGVSSDSVFYLSSADNFARGAGFFDFKGDPLTDFPPLYALILGVLTRISGISPFVWGRFFNAAVIALLIVSTAMLLKRCFPENRLWLILGTAITLVFLPLYTLAANIATDPLYILLTVWFCLAAQSLLETRSLRWLVLMTLLSLACTMLRWIGLAVVVSQFFLVWIAYRQVSKKAWLYAFLSSGIATIPVVLWVGVRNVVIYGTWGRAGVDPAQVNILQNLQLTADRMLAWTSPDPLVTFLPVVILFTGTVILLNRKQDYKRWFARLSHNQILPVILMPGVYFIAVTLTGYTGDHLNTFDDRYQAPLYFCLLILLFASLDELILNHLSGVRRTAALWVLVLLFGVWGIQRIQLLNQFVVDAKDRGVTAYNDYNNREFVRSGLVVYLIKNQAMLEGTLYSNEPEAVYFFLRRPVEQSPVDPTNYFADPANLVWLYPDWPDTEPSTLIWFKPNIKRSYYPPTEIEQIAVLDKIYKRWDGEIYQVRQEE